MHEATFIATVAVCFVFAFAFGYLADRLRLPPLVGYLVAGICVGPFTPGFEADGALAAELAEMGVILLMFGVGLHFSVRDLMAVRSIAVPGAVGQIVAATALGAGLAHLWGWTLGEGIVFGLTLSVASTVVLLKALEERNLLQSSNGRVAVGWLIVEDLAMVLTLVLLPAFAEVLGGHAATGSGAHAAPIAEGPVWMTLAVTLGKVALFVALAILLGPKVVPYLLKQVARTGSRELFTLSVLALAIGIAYGSAKVFGVSFALGAFFAGVVLSESSFSHRAAEESLPLQDAFSVLFFVSVGMLFDPMVLVRDPLSVLLVLALIVIGKGLIALGIVLALRYPLNMGLLVAASLAQIGEFSFILAGLGMALGLLPNEGRDLILAGALLSITLNPLSFHVVNKIRKRLGIDNPSRAADYGFKRYHALEAELEANRKRSEDRDRERDLELQALLATFPVLALVDRHEQEELLLLFRPKSAAPGERVIRRGDRPDGMYFISSGAVEVTVGDRKIRLDHGAFFGEMALVDDARRNADVTAIDYCQFLVLENRDFNQFMGRHPALRSAVSEMAEQRRAMNGAGAPAPADVGSPGAQVAGVSGS
ncbi:cation:proton antiporter domain-containing protein [Microvirga pudoricolor]|uniref:cation:proton antiporter domain-containing protein n=1 Tax=Microvirga pudoricolor TaxID=2778729 RepID=UPI00194F3AA1|nr:cation:proton antiporter [Microvirga pudoricolor]MBM6594244.1 cation:proton antiporter [Microvirga pudoricolor]